MKKLVGFFLTFSIAALLMLAVSPAAARNNQQASTWTAAIAYFNPTGTAGELTISYYPEDGSVLPTTELTVNSHYSGTVLVGATPGMEGSAVLSANFEMPAIYKTAASSGDAYSEILLEFFNAEQVGTRYYFIPNVQYNTAGIITRLGIQNVETVDIDLDLHFIDYDGTQYDYVDDVDFENILPQSSLVIKTSELTPLLPNGFNGALIIEAEQDGTTDPADIVAAAAGIDAGSEKLLHSYQGVKEGAVTIFLPAVFCSYGRSGLSSVMHIQNVNMDPISQNSITITYYDETGTSVSSYGTHGELASGQRVTIDVCSSAGVAGRKLSAVISHASREVAAVVETQNSSGLSAAYTTYTNHTTLGANSLYNIVLPYVEWSSSQWDAQSTLYIMNTGTSSATVTATFYRRDGTSEELTLNIPQNAAAETNPNLVPGLINMDHRDFKGAVMLSSDQYIMAVVLVTKNLQNPVNGALQTEGDGYMGMKYLP